MGAGTQKGEGAGAGEGAGTGAAAGVGAGTEGSEGAKKSNSVPPLNGVVIACRVLEDQIASLGESPYPVIYLDQGLHRTPMLLKQDLQDKVAACADYDVILFGYGLCSRSVIGLQGEAHQTLILPKIDDCIGISMGGRARFYTEFAKNPGTYYFTKGLVEAAEDPLKEYHKMVAKYDQETALWTATESLKYYERTVFIKTSPEGNEPSQAYAQGFADFFRLRYEEMVGANDFLKKLLFGPWDEDFVRVEGGRVVEDSMFERI